MTLPMPSSLVRATADKTASPSDLRTGTVIAVTARGVDVDVAGGLVEGAAHLSSYNPAVGDPVVLMRFQDAWIVLDRPVGPGTPEDLAVPGSGVGTTLLGGTVLAGLGGTIASSTGALVVVPRYRCTYFHPPGHQVLALCGVNWYCSVASDTMWVTLWDAANPAGSTQVSIMDLTQGGTNFFGNFETFGAMIPPPATGGRKVDLFMQIQRAGGAGTSRVDDLSARRGFLVALDMGDGSVVATV